VYAKPIIVFVDLQLTDYCYYLFDAMHSAVYAVTWCLSIYVCHVPVLCQKD